MHTFCAYGCFQLIGQILVTLEIRYVICVEDKSCQQESQQGCVI